MTKKLIPGRDIGRLSGTITIQEQNGWMNIKHLLKYFVFHNIPSCHRL